MSNNTKRILIISGVLLGIYLVYYFLIRKWMESEGMNTKLVGLIGNNTSTGIFRPSDLETLSYQQVQGLEKV